MQNEKKLSQTEPFTYLYIVKKRSSEDDDDIISTINSISCSSII